MKALFVIGWVSLTSACSSWNTGPADESGPERACLATCDALARAAERCGLEYKRAYDEVVVSVAHGDCKNVASIRDERLLREVCLPSIAQEDCTKVLTGDHDGSCSGQLQRPFARRAAPAHPSLHRDL